MRTVITFFLAILCSTSIAFAEVLSGSQSDYCTWSLDTETGILTISGSGAMNSSNRPWDTYRSYVTSLIIEDEVTNVGAYVFYDHSNLASITIGNSVTTIDKYAFFGCSSLTSITIPNNVTSIGDYAFRNCTSLTSVTIGNGVTNIGDYTFYNCTSLTSVTIPDSSVTTIGDYAFAYTGLTSVIIPESVTSIGSYAFNRCTSLTEIVFYGSPNIGIGAFYGATSLESVTCLSTTCPTVTINYDTYNAFYYVDDENNYVFTSATLYAASYDYGTAECWSLFSNIVYLTSTTISNELSNASSIHNADNAIVITTETAQTALVYNLSGQLVVKQAVAAGETSIGMPTGGVYIVALADGTKAKVLVK